MLPGPAVLGAGPACLTLVRCDLIGCMLLSISGIEKLMVSGLAELHWFSGPGGRQAGLHFWEIIGVYFQ